MKRIVAVVCIITLVAGQPIVAGWSSSPVKSSYEEDETIRDFRFTVSSAPQDESWEYAFGYFLDENNNNNYGDPSDRFIAERWVEGVEFVRDTSQPSPYFQCDFAPDPLWRLSPTWEVMGMQVPIWDHAFCVGDNEAQDPFNGVAREWRSDTCYVIQ